MATKDPKRQLTQGFGTETPFPVGRDFGPATWLTLEDAQNEGIPTGLPWNLLRPEEVLADHLAAAEEEEEEPHEVQPDSTRLGFALIGVAAGFFLGWAAASLL